MNFDKLLNPSVGACMARPWHLHANLRNWNDGCGNWQLTCRRQMGGEQWCQLRDTRCQMPDAGCQMPDADCQMPDASWQRVSIHEIHARLMISACWLLTHCGARHPKRQTAIFFLHNLIPQYSYSSTSPKFAPWQQMGSSLGTLVGRQAWACSLKLGDKLSTNRCR